jgi:23S rRNA (guanosine2251-2'-O)-methyltransferase
MVIYGINAVLEALKTGRVRKVWVSTHRRADARVARVAALAAKRGLRIDTMEPGALDRAAQTSAHQGVAAVLEDAEQWTPTDLLQGLDGPPLMVVLDGIEDPQNVGAILRTAESAGVTGVIRQARRAAPLDAVVAKASAGAVAHVRIATVVNIARALDEIKAAGVWTVGLAAEGVTGYDEIDFTLPTAIVLGSEGSGLRRLVRDKCDWLAAIPMAGRIGSLNVSVAAGVVLFEAVRQRRRRRPSLPPVETE